MNKLLIIAVFLVGCTTTAPMKEEPKKDHRDCMGDYIECAKNNYSFCMDEWSECTGEVIDESYR